MSVAKYTCHLNVCHPNVWWHISHSLHFYGSVIKCSTSISITLRKSPSWQYSMASTGMSLVTMHVNSSGNLMPRTTFGWWRRSMMSHSWHQRDLFFSERSLDWRHCFTAIAVPVVYYTYRADTSTMNKYKIILRHIYHSSVLYRHMAVSKYNTVSICPSCSECSKWTPVYSLQYTIIFIQPLPTIMYQ